MKKITNICQLPEWFDLDNYQSAYELQPYEWYLQIVQRKHFCTLLEYRTETHRPDLMRLAEDALSNLTQQTRGRDIRETNYILPHISNEKELLEHFAHFGAVTSLTLRHFTNSKFSLSEVHSWLDEAGENWDQIPNGTFNAADEGIKLADFPHENETKYATTRINMKLPDEVLIESFKVWLATTRRKENSKVRKQYRQLPFDRWARFGILPLLDLEIWCHQTGAKLPDHIISAALFPNADSGPDNIRKTIRPAAHGLIKNSSELMAVAALDISNRVLKKKVGNLQGL